MFDEEIRSIIQAKEYFRAMGCSGFHMSREYPKRYEEYKKLNISQQLEFEWRIEQFDEYYRMIMDEKADKSLWIIHSSMYDLLRSIKTDLGLHRILEITQFIRDKVPAFDRVIISETINGRQNCKFRSGLIYLAYDTNNIEIAKEFVDLSLYYSKYEESISRELERCRKATDLCNGIKTELGI